MDAGKLDRRIDIQRATVVSDGYGGEVQAWETLSTVWAEVEWVSDSERFRAAEVAANVVLRFRIHWGFDVQVTDRVIYDDKTYDIVGVKELGRREGQEITAAARAEG